MANTNTNTKTELSIPAEAWNSLKDEADPLFALCASDHQANLNALCDDAIRTGVAQTDFERKAIEIDKKRKTAEPHTPLGVSEPATALGVSEAKADAKAEFKPFNK